MEAPPGDLTDPCSGSLLVSSYNNIKGLFLKYLRDIIVDIKPTSVKPGLLKIVVMLIVISLLYYSCKNPVPRALLELMMAYILPPCLWKFTKK